MDAAQNCTSLRQETTCSCDTCVSTEGEECGKGERCGARESTRTVNQVDELKETGGIKLSATEGRTRWELQALLILCVEEGCFHRWLVPVYPETPHTHKHTLKHTHTRTDKHMLVR